MGREPGGEEGDEARADTLAAQVLVSLSGRSSADDYSQVREQSGCFPLPSKSWSAGATLVKLLCADTGRSVTCLMATQLKARLLGESGTQAASQPSRSDVPGGCVGCSTPVGRYSCHDTGLLRLRAYQ